MTRKAKLYAMAGRVAGLASCLVLHGCDRDEASASSVDASAPFGLDVLTVRDCPAPEHEKLSPDEHLLGVEVEVRANQTGIPANFYYGRVTDSQGNTYGPTFSGCSPPLSSPPLTSGESKRGFVNFKLPNRATGLTFTYAPKLRETEAGPASSVALPLGR